MDLDPGEPLHVRIRTKESTFKYEVTFEDSYFFDIEVNNAAAMSLQPDEIIFSGNDVNVTFMGFIEPKVNPAMNFDSQVIFKCPPGKFLCWYSPLDHLTATCRSDGTFHLPEKWPECVTEEELEEILKSGKYQVTPKHIEIIKGSSIMC